ncbi:hypothetical protein BTO02_12290 [Paraburkholderia sp. SOS3]|nr:hypothetical protein BTO02_12290 [Paraburkholderia sp. SOS3]
MQPGVATLGTARAITDHIAARNTCDALASDSRQGVGADLLHALRGRSIVSMRHTRSDTR